MAPPSLKDPTLRLIERLVDRLGRLERRSGPTSVAVDGTTLLGVDSAAAVPALAGLWLPTPFWRHPQAAQATAADDWFGGTSATHVVVWEANVPRQHACMVLRLLTGATAAATTGQYRILVDGETVDEWDVSTAGVAVDTRTVSLGTADWHALQTVQVSYARTVGAGTVYCHVTDAYARDT